MNPESMCDWAGGFGKSAALDPLNDLVFLDGATLSVVLSGLKEALMVPPEEYKAVELAVDALCPTSSVWDDRKESFGRVYTSGVGGALMSVIERPGIASGIIAGTALASLAAARSA
jgi:hypothetical protein